MQSLQTLKDAYITLRKQTIARSFLSARGLFLRLFNRERYWDELMRHEAQLLNAGVHALIRTLTDTPKTPEELKRYQLVLKNMNAKFTERGNFLLVLVTLTTALSLTKIPDIIIFSMVAAAIFLAVYDTVRVRHRVAIHEELHNVIERCLQSSATIDPILLPSSAPVQAPQAETVPPHPVPTTSSRTTMHALKMFVSRKASAGLFKAGTLCLGVALIGMSQTAITLYDKEVDAFTAKYRIEAVVGRPLEQIDCKFLKPNQADCLLAQQKVEFTESAGSLLDWVVRLALGLWASLYLSSFILFFSTPYARAIRARDALN
jgi:hypothetical protein